jgi:hypothetical protein
LVGNLLIARVGSLGFAHEALVNLFGERCQEPLVPEAPAGAAALPTHRAAANQVAVARQALQALGEAEGRGGYMYWVFEGADQDLRVLQERLSSDTGLEVPPGVTLEGLLRRLDGNTSIRQACAGAAQDVRAAQAEARLEAIEQLLREPTWEPGQGEDAGAGGRAQILEHLEQVLATLAGLAIAETGNVEALREIQGRLRGDAPPAIPAGVSLGMLLLGHKARMAIEDVCEAVRFDRQCTGMLEQPLLDQLPARDGKSRAEDTRAGTTRFLESQARDAITVAAMLDEAHGRFGDGLPNYFEGLRTSIEDLALDCGRLATRLREDGDDPLPAGITPQTLLRYVEQDLPLIARTMPPPGFTADQQAGDMRRLGHGTFNQTYLVRYGGAGGAAPAERVFKPIPTEEEGYATTTGVPQDKPRTAMRNLAASDVDRLLGFGVLVETHLAEGRRPGASPEVGIVMARARGEPAHSLRRSNPDLFQSARVRQQLLQLQLVDFLIGQLDRGLQNILVEATADGAIVKGIDQDQTFGDRVTRPEHIAYAPSASHWPFRGALLPPAIDAATAAAFEALSADTLRAALSPLLTGPEVTATLTRLDAIKAHVATLRTGGHVVDVAQLAPPAPAATTVVAAAGAATAPTAATASPTTAQAGGSTGAPGSNFTVDNSYIARCTTAGFEFLRARPRAVLAPALPAAVPPAAGLPPPA